MQPKPHRRWRRARHFRTFRAPDCAASDAVETRRYCAATLYLDHAGARYGHLVILAIVSVSSVCGCSITGNWERVETDPPGVPFPVDEVTFSDTNEYAARYRQYGRTQFSVGTYKLFGTRLDVQQYGSKPLTYSARVRRDGLLELVYSHEGQKVKALLRRTDEAAGSGEAATDGTSLPGAPQPTESEPQ